MRDKGPAREYKVDMRTLTLTLTVSLFIAMLAFFIVLNSFSSASSEKTASVRNSLTSAFGFVGAGLSNVSSGDDATGSAGDMEQATATGLRSVLPDLGFQSRGTSAGGRIMAVTVPLNDLEERWPALRARLGDLLVNKNTGGRYKMQLLALNGAAGSAGLIPLANELVEEGVDENLIGVGYEDRGTAAVELRFILAGG